MIIQKEAFIFLSVNALFLKLFGMFPLRDHSSLLQRIWYKFSRYTSIFFTYVMLIPVCLSMLLNKQDTVRVALNLLNIGIYLSSALTMHIFQRGEIEVGNLFVEVNNVFKQASNNGVTKVSMKKTSKLVRQTTLYWYGAITICAQVMAFYPIYVNESDERVLAVPTWYPFDIQPSPIYEILFAIHCIGQFNLTNIYGMADSFIMSVLLITGKQIELIGCNYENCVYTTLLKLGVSEDSVKSFSEGFKSCAVETKLENLHSFDEETHYTKLDYPEGIEELLKTNEFKDELIHNLHKIIKHHQKVMNFIRHLEDFMWPLLFVKLSASTLYHISICFMLLFEGNQTFMYTLGQYEIMAMYELLLIAYFGQYLITKSENLHYQIYSCPWYISTPQFRKSLVLAFIGCFRPAHLTVMKLSPLSLSTFVGILRTSTSYFTVLRQVVQR